MNNKKFATGVAVCGAALAAFVTPTASASTPPTETSVTAEAGAAAAEAVERAQLKCSRPSGAVVNYSWGTGSSDSTTVYFNNHCSHKMDALLHFQAGGGQKKNVCMSTNGDTKGKKRFTITRYHLKSITKGC